jgi:hypothetical protein
MRQPNMGRNDRALEPLREAERIAWEREIWQDGGIEFRRLVEFTGGSRLIGYPTPEGNARVLPDLSHDPNARVRVQRRTVTAWEDC